MENKLIVGIPFLLLLTLAVPLAFAQSSPISLIMLPQPGTVSAGQFSLVEIIATNAIGTPAAGVDVFVYSPDNILSLTSPNADGSCSAASAQTNYQSRKTGFDGHLKVCAFFKGALPNGATSATALITASLNGGVSQTAAIKVTSSAIPSPTTPPQQYFSLKVIEAINGQAVPLAGVTVIDINPVGIAARIGETDAQGRINVKYALKTPPSGTYAIYKFEKSGYNSQTAALTNENAAYGVQYYPNVPAAAITLKKASSATATCFDSDGGFDFYSKGSISVNTDNGSAYTNFDQCFDDGKTLLEYGCKPPASSLGNNYQSVDGYSYAQIYRCQNGCSNGACVKNNSVSTCVDSDGDNPNVTGSVKLTGGIYEQTYGANGTTLTDACNAPTEATDLTEWVCIAEGTNAKGKQYKCPNGCKNGACVTSPAPSCTITTDPNPSVQNEKVAVEVMVRNFYTYNATYAAVDCEGNNKGQIIALNCQNRICTGMCYYPTAGTFAPTAVTNGQVNCTTTQTVKPATLRNGLVGEWTFNDGNALTATDSSGNGNNGAIGATPVDNGCVKGACLKFNGANGSVKITQSTTLRPTTVTVSAWAKSATPTWNAYGWIVSMRNGYIIHPNLNEKTVSFFFNINGYWQAATANVQDITVWHQYAMTYDGTTITAYIDGAKAATQQAPGRITYTNADAYIGSDSNIASRFGNGAMDEVKIWNRPLSASEIQQVYSQDLQPASGTTARASTTGRVVAQTTGIERLIENILKVLGG